MKENEEKMNVASRYLVAHFSRKVFHMFYFNSFTALETREHIKGNLIKILHKDLVHLTIICLISEYSRPTKLCLSNPSINPLHRNRFSL